MKQNLYQIYDLRAQTVGGPIIVANKDEIVIRDFHRLLSDKNTDPGKYPEDYSLIQLGTQDTDTGTIEAVAPTLVMSGKAWAEMMTHTKENK